MKTIKFAIENYRFSLTVLFSFAALGLYSFFTMPKMEDPQVAMPGATIAVVFPGANSLDIEQLVVDPIERSLNELEDIKEIKSKIEDGLAVATIEFQPGSDPDEKFSKVAEKINQIKSSLPNEIYDIILQKWDVTDINIIQYALIYDDNINLLKLDKIADDVKKEFSKVDGVKKVSIHGLRDIELQIMIDVNKLAFFKIPLTQVLGAIETSNKNIPGGDLKIGSKNISVKTSGSFKSLSDIENIVVHSSEGKIVKLKDIAEIAYKRREGYFARFNGRNCAFITASQKKGTNIFSIVDEIKFKANELYKTLPDNVKLELVYDQSERTKKRIQNFFENFIQGVILVGFFTYLTIGFVPSVVVMAAVPVSILIAMAFMDFFGYAIEQITLVGLVISLSLLVSAAIFVAENISRYLRMGKNPTDAAIEGTREVAGAVFNSTLTTILAFVPLMTLNNTAGEFIRGMSVMVSLTLAASVVVSFTLTAVMSAKFLNRDEENVKKRYNFINQKIIDRYYLPSLNFALNHKVLTLSLVAFAVLASVVLLPFVGYSLFPKAETNVIMLDINLPKGSSLDETNKATKFAEVILSNDSFVLSYASNIGKGNPWIYYNSMPKQESKNYANILIQTKKFDRKEIESFIKRTRKKLADYPGASFELRELQQGVPMEAPITIKIIGDNFDKLSKCASKTESILNNIEGVINVFNPVSTNKYDLKYIVNREKAGILGVPLELINKVSRASIAGIEITKFKESNGKEYPIVVKTFLNKNLDISDLNRILIPSLSGAYLPLNYICDIVFEKALPQIEHYNLERTITVTADVERGYIVDKIASEANEKLMQSNFPSDVKFIITGEVEKRKETFGDMYWASIIAALTIFAVLVFQFNSFAQTGIIFTTAPLGFIGSIFALFLFKSTFSFTAFIGAISLIGIVVNNGIVLIDYANQLRKNGYSKREAIVESCRTRILPIILSSFTTIAGLAPLTLLGGELWEPMGLTIIGGLFVSTALTLIVCPIFYVLKEEN